MILAGYETTSLNIMWTLFLLAKHPAIQNKLSDEIDSIIGKDRAPTGNYNQLNHFFSSSFTSFVILTNGNSGGYR